MLPFATRYKGRLAAALFALVVASAATLTTPIAVRGVVDHGFSADGLDALERYFGVMLVVVAVLAVASAARYYLVVTFGERIVADLRKEVFGRLATLDAAFFDRSQTGELISRLTADTTQIKASFGTTASLALRNLFLFIGAIVMMIYTSPTLSGLVLIAIPCIVLPLRAAGRDVRARSRQAQDTLAAASAYAAENLGAVRTMQAFNAEEHTRRRFSEAVEEAFFAAMATARARAIVVMLAILLAFGSVLGVIWLGAQSVIDGKMTGGLLAQFVLYAIFGAASLGQLSEVWNEVSQAAGAAGRLAEILETEPDIASPSQPRPLPKDAEGKIQFDSVSFRYPGGTREPVLDNISFTINKGEAVAIVGPSGAGKSTIFNLLLRYYDPTEGCITINGMNIADLDLTELRDQFAIVPQDPTIFATTIAENIKYGTEQADISAVEQASHQAQAADFIASLELGYDSKVGERGVTLSGGQRQRLAVARAILKASPIILLDEATSALDSENERLVRKAIDDLIGTRTILVIAHRLSTVLKSDRILVIEKGRIVEEGTNQSLSAEGGLFSRLKNFQFDIE